MDEKMQKLMEQVILSYKARFGRSSEKMDDPQQISFTMVDGEVVFFNEVEAEADLEAPEPDDLEVKPKHGKKTKSKKAKDLEGIHVERKYHYMNE